MEQIKGQLHLRQRQFSEFRATLVFQRIFRYLKYDGFSRSIPWYKTTMGMLIALGIVSAVCIAIIIATVLALVLTRNPTGIRLIAYIYPLLTFVSL